MISNKQLLENVIQWNRQQFFKAIRQERFDDAQRFKENVERLEELDVKDPERGYTEL